LEGEQKYFSKAPVRWHLRGAVFAVFRLISAFGVPETLLQAVLPEHLMPRANRLFRDSPKVKIVSI